MKPLAIVGVVLIVFGVLALAYQGFSYTRSEKVVDLGPIEVNRESKEHVPLAPAAGIVALVGGLILVGFSRKGH